MSLVEVTFEGTVAVLTLTREEKLNALSTQVERELGAALRRDDMQASRCVVLAGRGRAFSGGADTGELRDRSAEQVLAYYRDTGDVYEQVAALPCPTVAAVHGYCLGGGLELALACDLRVADETAVLGFPEVGIGILPSSGGTARATRLLGAARAKELILLGDRIDASRALQLGLVSEVVPAGDALGRALELAGRLAAQPPLAVSLAKGAIDAAAESSRQAAILIERLAYGLLSQTADAKGDGA
jgi:enoyl-CoA hydratase/carnithine racemase